MQGGGNLFSLIISFINSQKSKSKLMEFTKTDNLSDILFEAIVLECIWGIVYRLSHI